MNRTKQINNMPFYLNNKKTYLTLRLALSKVYSLEEMFFSSTILITKSSPFRHSVAGCDIIVLLLPEISLSQETDWSLTTLQ